MKFTAKPGSKVTIYNMYVHILKAMSNYVYDSRCLVLIYLMISQKTRK